MTFLIDGIFTPMEPQRVDRAGERLHKSESIARSLADDLEEFMKNESASKLACSHFCFIAPAPPPRPNER